VIEDLQYTLGEGAMRGRLTTGPGGGRTRPGQPASPRWFGFHSRRSRPGHGRCSGFPGRVLGAARLGALNLYQDQPGPLSDEQHADALVMADRGRQLGPGTRKLMRRRGH